MAILFITAAAMLAASSRLRPAADKIEKQSLDTALYELNLETYADLVPPPAADGGAIKSHGSALMLLTGDGKFYWITESVGGLHAEALRIPAPMDRAAYLAGFSDPSKAPRLRTTDLIFDRSPAPTSLYVAHQSWDIKNRCYTQRVSVMALAWTMDGHPRASGAWRALFDSKPCVRAEGPFDDSETGGKLAWAPDGRLLFTLGSLGFAGLNGQMPFSQRSDVDYGKILKIDPGTGQYTIFTTGNRNPQGLVVTGDGQIWEAEHGPQGGDEINFIEQGANYGWPYATYGTDYGSKTWPLNPDGHDHGVYHEPAIAFVPSAAISPLIELNGAEFPHWKGDLLAGSLRTEALFRIRTRGTLVIYVESFSVGHRVRDLAEMANGRIVVWSDDGTLIELSRNDHQSVFAASCAGCHEPKFGAAVGPPLAGVVGRRIASAPGFTYSRGLRSQSGVWDERTLDAFLRDPAAFASGTTMQRIRLDDKSRAAVIAELKAKH
jgi:cytochrome c2